jgi:hypothetical protein
MSKGVDFVGGSESFVSNKDYNTQPSEPSQSKGPVETPAYDGTEFAKSFGTTTPSGSMPSGAGSIVTPIDVK